MTVMDGHGGHAGITTHQSGPKCQKNSIFKKIGKVFGSWLADRLSQVIRNTGIFFLAQPKKIRSIIISICYLYTVLINFLHAG